MRVYSNIADQIRQAIQKGALGEGTLLLEGPLAEIFGSSRSPVKQALGMLKEEGLLSPFKGRGLLVGQTDRPRRIPVTRELLGLPEVSDYSAGAKVPAWRSIWYEFEREIILRSVFGTGTLNELALARHFNAGRTVARDLLLHANEVGIVRRDTRSRWSIVQLDEGRFDNLYQLRIMLEPVALGSAIGRMSTERLEKMAKRCSLVAMQQGHDGREALDRMERDLHIDCIDYAANPELPRALIHSHCMLFAGKHIQAEVGLTEQPIQPMIAEHLSVLEAMMAEKRSQAVDALVAHLEASRARSASRLTAFRTQSPSYELEYVTT